MWIYENMKDPIFCKSGAEAEKTEDEYRISSLTNEHYEILYEQYEILMSTLSKMTKIPSSIVNSQHKSQFSRDESDL